MTTKEQLEAEIQELRLELGDTVAQLSQHLDVKHRVQEKVARVPWVPVSVVGAALVVLLVWRKRS